MKHSIAQQIEEVEREIKLRREVYPRMVSAGKMRQSVSEYHLDRMLAVLTTLEWLRANEETVRAAVAAKEKAQEPKEST